MAGDDVRGRIDRLSGLIDEIGRELSRSPGASMYPGFEEAAKARLALCRQDLRGMRERSPPEVILGDPSASSFLREAEKLQGLVDQYEEHWLPPLRSQHGPDPRVIALLQMAHESHGRTHRLAFAVELGAMKVQQAEDDERVAPVYHLPASHRQYPRQIWLLLHEFGHVMYARIIGDLRDTRRLLHPHTTEAQDLVSAVLEGIRKGDGDRGDLGRLLCPSDLRSSSDERLQDAWRLWVMEFFCDAVGLALGGREFLSAFVDHVYAEAGMDLLEERNRKEYTHPAAALRLQVLARLDDRWNRGSDLRAWHRHPRHPVMRVLVDGISKLVDGLELREKAIRALPANPELERSGIRGFLSRLVPRRR